MNNLSFLKEFGYLIIDDLIPKNLIDEYKKRWLDEHAKNFDGTTQSITNIWGWTPSNCFYNVPIITEVLWHESIQKLLNDLNLQNLKLRHSFTAWTPSQTYWHQDSIFEDKETANNYVVIWIALEDLDIRSGLLSFVPKSHNWEIDFTIYNKPFSESIASDYFSQIIKNHKENENIFLAKKGQAIIWQGHLIHRAIVPENKNIPRPSIIGHYKIG